MIPETPEMTLGNGTVSIEEDQLNKETIINRNLSILPNATELTNAPFQFIKCNVTININHDK